MTSHARDNPHMGTLIRLAPAGTSAMSGDGSEGVGRNGNAGEPKRLSNARLTTSRS